MIVCETLVKIYKTQDLEVMALQGLDLTVARGEMMAIVGNSGSGKSTLLNLIGGLDRPSAGVLRVDDKDMLKLTDVDLMRYRRDTVGFVWQNNARNLIPYLSALENVELPMIFTGRKNRQRANMLLEAVGLAHRKNSKLMQLSGGEQQRVAIAIALSNEPKLLLADEPTGSVDSKTSRMVVELLRDLSRTMGVTVVIVTHDRSIARGVDRCVAIRDGQTSSEMLRKRSYAEDMASQKGFEQPEEQTHEELAVLDRAGRVQIPREYLDAMNVSSKQRIKIDMVDGKVVLTAPREEKDHAENKRDA